jgi:hypothetical protein
LGRPAVFGFAILCSLQCLAAYRDSGTSPPGARPAE